jgi:hypothetical protein
VDIHVQGVTRPRVGSTDRENAKDKGQGIRPESDGPATPQPPAIPDPAPPASPEKKPDVHGHPEPPA